jgi:predicted AAA+ superfamily ATPase
MRTQYIQRSLKVPERSFFLFGPRGVGKTTWLKKELPNAAFFDLLDSALYLELSQQPANLGPLVGDRPPNAWVVIDEIQKIPELLDEVHRLIETRGWRFALSGSSARKLRRGGINLLGGRAVTRYLDTFSSRELGKSFDAEFTLQSGLLPYVQLDKKNAADILSSYVSTYIKEEIKEEGIVRRVPPFLRFLNIAGLLNGQMINRQNISREAAVPRSTVDTYFSILEDTLLGHFLPAYRPNLKVREQTHPKFYWFDPGVARAAAGLIFDPIDRLWMGTALENLIDHELRVYNHIQKRNRPIYFYRSGSGSEIDFVIETQKRRPDAIAHIVCIEVKVAKKWDRKWERPMRFLSKDPRIHVAKMMGVYMGERTYHFDGIDVLPLSGFLDQLHSKEIF